jgi:hypothetical protein
MRPQTVIDIDLLKAAHERIELGRSGLRRWCAWPTPRIIRRFGEQYPVIAQSLQLAPSQQIRNLGGNVLQRTREEVK